jgi:hypothetical protein
MPLIKRRAALLRLLAHIDQQIQESKSLADHPRLTAQEKRFVRVHLQWRQEAMKCVEAMLDTST